MRIREKIIDTINDKKNIRLDEFINNCLYNQDAYYIKKNPIGKYNDFVTAPEISQMFGEIIGSYIINYWITHINSTFNLVELGPGKGSLLKDILRVAEYKKKFLRSAKIYLIEKNKELIKIQKKNINHSDLNITWKKELAFNSSIPSIIYSNEFFDCLAIRQFLKKEYWLEKYVSYNRNTDQFYFVDKKVNNKKLITKLEKLYENDIVEISSIRERFFDKICKKIKKDKGIIITIDYGYNKSLNNFSLQAVFNHKKTHIFDNVGKQDISSLVNFNDLISIAKKNDLKIDFFSNQKKFLLNYGIVERKNHLKKSKSKEEQKNIDIAFERLTNDEQMGKKFKVLIVSS